MKQPKHRKRSFSLPEHVSDWLDDQAEQEFLPVSTRLAQLLQGLMAQFKTREHKS